MSLSLVFYNLNMCCAGSHCQTMQASTVLFLQVLGSPPGQMAMFHTLKIENMELFLQAPGML